MPVQPILDQGFWFERYKRALDEDNLHKAVFDCSIEKWRNISQKHVQLLHDKYIPSGSFGNYILDVGCGWGRLMNLLPRTRIEHYTGIDFSPDFIKRAMQWHGCHTFYVGEAHKVIPAIKPFLPREFDLAIMISFRPMILRNLGAEYWKTTEEAIKSVAKKLLYLEYDENCEGFLEER